MNEAVERRGKGRRKNWPELKEGEYFIPSLKKIVRQDGDRLTDLPEHNIADVTGKDTGVKCPSRTGYALIVGKYPAPLAKARCGTYGHSNPPCWKTWR